MKTKHLTDLIVRQVDNGPRAPIHTFAKYSQGCWEMTAFDFFSGGEQSSTCVTSSSDTPGHIIGTRIDILTTLQTPGRRWLPLRDASGLIVFGMIKLDNTGVPIVRLYASSTGVGIQNSFYANFQTNSPLGFGNNSPSLWTRSFYLDKASKVLANRDALWVDRISFDFSVRRRYSPLVISGVNTIEPLLYKDIPDRDTSQEEYEISVNGVRYLGGTDFTYNRITRTISWNAAIARYNLQPTDKAYFGCDRVDSVFPFPI